MGAAVEREWEVDLANGLEIHALGGKRSELIEGEPQYCAFGGALKDASKVDRMPSTECKRWA